MISVIILTCNSAKFIPACLDSVFRRGTADECEIIVVDNGSTDDSAALIKSRYPRARLIENQRNLGPCKARNQGIAASCGEWILTLDSDVELADDFLAAAQEAMARAPADIGMLQPKILMPDRKTIYSFGIYLCWSRRFYDIGYKRKDTGQFDRAETVFGPCAAAAFYRRAMLEDLKEETGCFDERFFFMAEDLDLAWRAQRRGWKCLFMPTARCFHAGNSASTDKALKQYLCFRNRFYAIKKNEGTINYLKKFFPAVCYDLPRACYLFAVNPWLRRGRRAEV